MGHHMKRNMVKLREDLDALTVANSGVDGEEIYVYGEGWNFGEVADNARGVNATQRNMAGTGIGTFNDRIRDYVRGGGPFDNGADLRIKQGFATGLFPRIKSRALASNNRSLNVLEKAGFRRLGEGPEPVGHNAGKPVVFLELEQPKWT